MISRTTYTGATRSSNNAFLLFAGFVAVVSQQSVLMEVHGFVTPSPAISLPLQIMRRGSHVRQTTTRHDLEEEKDNGNDTVLDAHEFEPTNKTVIQLFSSSGNNTTASNISTTNNTLDVLAVDDGIDPLQSLGNLTHKLTAFTRQFEYQLSLASTDRTTLEKRLEESQIDRQKLLSTIQTLRHDKANASKAVDRQQAKVVALQHTVDEQEQYIHRTESSTRHLLLLLGKLMWRRLGRLLIFLFPFVVRLVKSIFRFVSSFWDDNDVDDAKEDGGSKDPAEGIDKPNDNTASWTA